MLLPLPLLVLLPLLLLALRRLHESEHSRDVHLGECCSLAPA